MTSKTVVLALGIAAAIGVLFATGGSREARAFCPIDDRAECVEIRLDRDPRAGTARELNRFSTAPIGLLVPAPMIAGGSAMTLR